MGGIGKTQIALEYCHQAHFSDNHFASVFWVNAHSEEALTTSFVKLAETLGRSSIASFSTEEKVEFVLGSLNAWPHPYLLVYDNYDNPDFDNVLKYTPSYGSGALLFTSRLRSAASLLQNAIQVDVMTEEEALDLLISRSGLRGSASRDTDRIHGSKVVQILDGLPLALDQAAAYIRASNGNVTLENFVDCFEQRKKEILDHTPPVWLYRNTADENEKRRYLSVFTTWELSLRLLGSNAEDREKKTRFLTLAAFLGGHRVSKVLFKTYIARQANSYVSAIENGWSDIFRGSTRFDDNRFRDVIVELNDLSLIRGFTETNSGGLHFTVHSLVQEWARSRLELEKQKVLSREATSIMTHLFQEFQSKLSLNPDISKLVTDENPRLSAAGKDAELLATEMIVEIAAHVLACLKHADEIGPKLDGSGIAEQYFASFMETCDIDQAAQLWERLLEHAWLHYGDDSPRTFELLRYVCGLRAMQKPNPDRKKWMEELLQRLHVVEIHDDPNTLLLLCNLSCLYAEIGPLETYKETIAKLTNALQGVTLQSNQIFLYVALKTLENLIMLAQLQAAEALLDRVLEALEFYSLEERAWIFSEWVMEPLYKLFMIQEKFKDAEEAVEEDLQRQILRWGHDHPVVISVRAESLAKCYAAQGRWHDAANAVEPYFHYLRRAIGICHPLTQRKGLHLAECYIRAHPDDMDEADEVVADILTSQRKTHGPMCYRTLQLEREAANMYSMCGKYRTAFMMYKSAYETHREWLGPEDEVVISLEGLYAISLTKVPDRSESEIADVSGMLAPQIAVLEAQYGLNGTLTMCVRQVLLDFSYGVQKYEHALDLAQIQLAIREELDPSSYSSWQSRGYLIACYRRLGRHDEALELLSKGVEWMRAREGDNSDTTISALETLADTCSAAGKYEKAEELYQKILRHRIKKFGSHHIQTMLMRKSLALNRSNAGLFPGAVEEFKTILTWARMRYGEEDEKTIELIILIAHSTFKQKTPAKLLEAESYYTMVVKWFTKHKQGKIELVLVANSWMVECLIAASKHSEAILYEEKRLNILETKQNFGPNAELTINTAFNLAGLYLVVSDFAKARPLCERVLAWQKGVHGPNNIKTLAAMFGVGLAYIGLEQYAEAKLYLLQIVESRAIMFGGDGMTRDLLPYLSGVARALENWAEAEGYQLRILELSQKANASAEILMEGRYHVAVMRLRQGKALEAELDLAQALAWRMQHLGLHHPDTMNNCYWYAESQYQLQDYKMAAEHFGFILDYKGEGTPVPEERFQQARERVEACRSKIAAVEGMATLKLSDGQSATTQ
jgi:tetratricopeptide (TPR) repeat protein